jgi:tRNA-splicing ligase RtcB
MGINGRDLMKIGWEPGPALGKALELAKEAQEAGWRKRVIMRHMDLIRTRTQEYLDDELLRPLAQLLLELRMEAEQKVEDRFYHLEVDPVPCGFWGEDGVDQATIDQMEVARRLPVSVAAALMPDGHLGYGLPIGGVLATRDAVIPYAVGVDIACRMKLTVTDVPMARFEGIRDKLKNALNDETAFGMGAQFNTRKRRKHDVLDDPAWDDLPRPLQALKDKAWSQLGSSGGGNHFVEFGVFEHTEEHPEIPLEPGEYLALLSHSGSRGLGARTAEFFTKIAMENSKLPKEARYLAWLPLDTEEGVQYWKAMNLAGRYAEANHTCIHRHVLKAAGLKPVLDVENHHNFAWKEKHGDEELIVHRKGSTPAGHGVLGIIPGSMGAPGFLVRGKGKAESLNSASHGAGRAMSRAQAKKSLTKHDMLTQLSEQGIELLGGGLDEAPGAYKDIHQVIAAQRDLIDPLATFHPRLVLMASD